MRRILELGGGRRLEFEGVLVLDAWEVFTKEANGHKEVSFKNAIAWTELGEFPSPSFDEYLDQFDGEQRLKREAEHLKELEEKQAKQREKSAQRAKGKCRWLIKAHGLDELLTLTYRDNQDDRALCKTQFKEWVRRMKVALGGEFVYCASFERQKRGAMHVHCACHKLPKHVVHKGVKIEAWRLGTAIWRAIIGRDNGLCFVGGKKAGMGRSRSRAMSIAKLAAYVSKYIMKDYADAPNESNRYSRTNGLSVPKAEKIRIAKATFAEMLDLVFQVQDGDVIVSHRITKNPFSGDRYWLVTEPDPCLRVSQHP